MFGKLVAGALAFAATSTATAQQPSTSVPRKIPAADFARRPVVSDPILSPDGKRLAGLFEQDGKPLVGVFTLADGKYDLVRLPEKQDLRWYRWAGPNRILISVAQTVFYYGEETVMTRLFSYDLDTRKFVLLGGKGQGLEGDDLLYADPAGEWVLLSFQRTLYDYPSVFRVELADNKMREVVRQRTDVWEWFADSDGVVRAGVGFSDRNWSMIYRRREGDKFERIGKARYDDPEAALDVLRFARESDEGYVLDNKDNGRYALYRYNFATRERGELVLANAANDIQGFDIDDGGAKLRSAYYTDDRHRIVWYDETMKAHQADVDNAIKDKENWIGSRSSDDKIMLVWSGAAHDPGRYYIYQPAAGVMKKVAEINNQIKPSELSPSRYVKYKARDGLEIPAYLTLPRGRPAKGLPLVILPHGGPYDVRDEGHFDPEVQFLANRGYAVLQPQFRGSGSYGRDFYEKGEGQWGRRMQDDLDDGMDWLASDGTIDPRRVCIVGSSYGGYAALWGATRNPERYRCAASFAGVSDLGRQLKYQLAFAISKRYRKDWRRKVQGEKDFDTATVSPLYTIDRLKVPVLLAHGDADQTVPFKQSSLYVEALKKAGKDVEFYPYPGEGHGLSTEATLEDWLNRLEAFLAKHNPAG